MQVPSEAAAGADRTGSATRTRPGAGGGDGTGWGIGVSDRGDTSGLWTRGTTVDAPAQVIARGGKPGETRDKASTLVTRDVALSTSLRRILMHPLALGPVERRNRHGEVESAQRDALPPR